MPVKFNISLADSQATPVEPVKVENFDFDAYREYTENLDRKCKAFWEAESGVLVYRRMRVAECFSYGCRDMRHSLELQLCALQKSMQYKGDVPNFLEPWYGIGTVSSAFGVNYVWPPGNAPAIKPKFDSLQEMLDYEPTPVAETETGRHTLDMIEYFMEMSQGKIPVSLTDSQSPLNIIGNIYPVDKFFMDLMTAPEMVVEVLDRLADLSIAFNEKQRKLIGDALASPGHGFPSSRTWKGLGMSDDNTIMIAPEQYLDFAAPSVERIAEPFGGPAFHSCGNWERWIEAVLGIKGLLMADGAFSPETDPDANRDFGAFHRFTGTGVVLNARMVGDLGVIEEGVRGLWKPGMKLVVTTYCQTPEEQNQACDMIHEICAS